MVDSALSIFTITLPTLWSHDLSDRILIGYGFQRQASKTSLSGAFLKKWKGFFCAIFFRLPSYSLARDLSKTLFLPELDCFKPGLDQFLSSDKSYEKSFH